jgi:ubiquinone/menaquinone biosynthesis C-methylase UbiE
MGNSEFKDLFSGHAKDYSKFRPTYPAALFDYLASVCVKRQLALDVGTGNGQAAVELAKLFDHVLATDPSRKQLDAAETNSKIEYVEAAAEKIPAADRSADIITVAQAFHWFEHEKFFEEAKRVSKADGILAVWCYELAEISQEVNEVVTYFYKKIVGKYWEPERKFVETGYKTIAVPFKEISPPAFEMTAKWSLEHLVGYLGTWSATQKAKAAKNKDPVAEILPDLERAWRRDPPRIIRWPLSLRVFKINI